MSKRAAASVGFAGLFALSSVLALSLPGCPPRPGGDEGDDPFTARYWVKSYGGARADQANSVQATADGGFIVAGSSERLVGDSDAAVIKLDSAGNVEWSRLYGDSPLEFSADSISALLVQATADGGYVLVGNLASNGNRFVQVEKVNAGGGLEWRRTHEIGPWSNPELGAEDDVEPSASIDTPHMVRQSLNGGYLIAGLSKAVSGVTIDGVAYPEETQLFVLALAPDGELQWRRRYGELGEEEQAPAIAPEADGGAFLCAPHDRTSDAEDVSSIWRLGYGGGVYWSQVRESDAFEVSAGLAHFHVVLQTDDDNDGQADDGVVFVGSKTTSIVHPVDDEDTDFWLLKLNSLGEEEWEELIDESGNYDDDIATAVTQARVRFGDGRAGAWLIVAGKTGETFDASQDAWVANVDARDGSKITALRFGAAESNEETLAVAAIDSEGDGTDDGCVLTGYVTASGFARRGWVARVSGLDSMTLDWQTFFELPHLATMDSATPTADGGVLISGRFGPQDRPGDEPWLMKLSGSGEILWRRLDGESAPKLDSFEAIRQVDENGDGVADGGYIAVGSTTSFGAGGHDCWIVRLAQDGEIVWQKALGGAQDDQAAAIALTPDGGFAVAGFSASIGQGGRDVWVVRVSPGGEVLWERSFGGLEDDEAGSVCALPDGAILVAGYSRSFHTNQQNATEPPPQKAWLLTLAADGQPIQQSVYGLSSDSSWRLDSLLVSEAGGAIASGRARRGTVFAKFSAAGAVEWSNLYVAGDPERPAALCPMPEGGFAITTTDYVERGSPVAEDPPADLDLVVIRCNSFGERLWSGAYGTGGSERGGSIGLAGGDGLIIVGQTDGITDSADFWALRTNADGGISGSCAGSIGMPYEQALNPIELVVAATDVAAVSSPAPAWSVRDTPVAARRFGDFVETRQCFGNDRPDPDADFDGIQDTVDNCPGRSNNDQGDSDFDGVGDACDGCPENAGLRAPGPCGCGAATGDHDADGTLDCNDLCPEDPNKTAPGACGCGNAESPDCAGCPDGDDDEDGVCNSVDRCPQARDNLDADGDGVPDCLDNCPAFSNSDQLDANSDGVGDACQPQGTTFRDTEMLLWTVYDTQTSGSVEIGAQQQSSDGNGNTDPYRRMSYALGPDATIDMVHVQTAFTLPWSPPGSNGRALDRLDLSIDARRISPFIDGLDVQGGFVIRQQDVVYRTSPEPILGQDWTADARTGLVAADFTDAFGRHPDFSASGGILGFGYYRLITSSLPKFVPLIEGVDNFTVTALAVP